MKPVFLYGNNSDVTVNPSHADHTYQMVHVSYPPTDPYLAGLVNAYGPQAIIQPQMGSQAVGMPPTRVPLPLNVPDDGPIYVNAKQYNGIMRRRQSRAKLEAQNKLVKSRKPYLHESRHLHALNRVRGSGGRFLSTKKLQQANPQEDPSGQNSHRARGNDMFDPTTNCSEMTSVTNCNTFFHHADRAVAGISGPVGVRRNGGPLLDASGLRSSSVR
ncbi:hypothetical protein CRG98_033794 [Punica granatum]|nr:hypothetical protein CRG98_033794 [Punica granatum]